MSRALYRIIFTRSGTLGTIFFVLTCSVVAMFINRLDAEPPPAAKPKEITFMNEVSGEFDVKIVPVDTGDDKMGMMMLDKQYHGDLNAVGKGRMLTAMGEVKGSAVYVAVERVKGKLKGAEGSFLIHHTGVMSKERQSMVIRVVPDSGTGDLAGIDGQMHLKIADGKHFYRFEYTLGAKK